MLCICAHIQVYALDLALKGYRKYWDIAPPSRHPYFKQPTHCDDEIECSNHHYPLVVWGRLSCPLWILSPESESRSVMFNFVTPWTTQSMEFSRPEHWSGWLFPSPGDLPSLGIEPRFPTLQVDSLPAEPQASPKILEWVTNPFSGSS